MFSSSFSSSFPSLPFPPLLSLPSFPSPPFLPYFPSLKVNLLQVALGLLNLATPTLSPYCCCMLCSCTASAPASHAFPDFLHKSVNFPSRLQHCISHAELKMQVRLLSILLGAVLLLQSSRVHAHVRLTFPPARFPDYDFLDNVRTGGPCGIPGE